MLWWLKQSRKSDPTLEDTKTARSKDGGVVIHTLQIYLLVPIKQHGPSATTSHTCVKAEDPGGGHWGRERQKARPSTHPGSQTTEFMSGC